MSKVGLLTAAKYAIPTVLVIAFFATFNTVESVIELIAVGKIPGVSFQISPFIIVLLLIIGSYLVRSLYKEFSIQIIQSKLEQIEAEKARRTAILESAEDAAALDLEDLSPASS